MIPKIALAALVPCFAVPATAENPPELFLEEQQVFPPVPVAGGQYGYACAVSGNTAVVGARVHDGPGAAFVLVREAGGWTLQELLQPAGLAAGTYFGVSVAIDGDTLVVGAMFDDGGAADSGAAYVFVRSGGAWSLEQKLVASDGAANDRFGSSVALDGDLVVVGAEWESTIGFSSGAAYAFSRSGGTWTEEAKLLPSRQGIFAEFGRAVTLSGDTAVVGQPWGAGAQVAGSMFAFVRSAGGVWTEQQELVPAASATADRIGRSLVLEGDTLVAAGPAQISASAPQTLVVFERVGGAWTESTPITADDIGLEAFGSALALDGDVLLVGSGRNTTSEPSGSAYVFDRVGASWIQRQQLTPSGPFVDERFGLAVGLSGPNALVGAYGNDELGPDVGSAYFFRTRPDPFGAFCDASDAALDACPCGNPGAPDSGCDNPAGTGGVRLDVTSFTPAQHRAELRGTGFPAMSSPTVLLIRSSALIGNAVPLGDGVRCLAPPIVRLNAVLADLGASATDVTHLAGPGTFHYQLWYRSTPAGYCDPAAEFNTSNGVAIPW